MPFSCGIGAHALREEGFFRLYQPYHPRNAEPKRRKKSMAFFNSAVGVLQTLVIALGAGLGIDAFPCCAIRFLSCLRRGLLYKRDSDTCAVQKSKLFLILRKD